MRLAYDRLPPHRFSRDVPHFRVKLVLTPPAPRSGRGAEPAHVRALAAGGILCGAIDGSGFATLTVSERNALIVVPHNLLRYAYHVRYELLEFAVYILAARMQRLVPLHAACIGRRGQGILLLGPSGSGKSTLVLQCLHEGLDFLAEDSVLVRPQSLLATGVANFLHLRPDALRFLDSTTRRALLRTSPIIRRRSGERKLEIDLRRPAYRLAAAPLRIQAVLFLSTQRASSGRLLVPMPRSALLERLAVSQRYAATQAGWGLFRDKVSALPSFELRRGSHPHESVEVLRGLLPAR